MPQCIEETQPELLEAYLNKLVVATNKEGFCGFPFQKEAFAMSFEDKFTVYTISGDFVNNRFTLLKDKQYKT